MGIILYRTDNTQFSIGIKKYGMINNKIVANAKLIKLLKKNGVSQEMG